MYVVVTKRTGESIAFLGRSGTMYHNHSTNGTMGMEEIGAKLSMHCIASLSRVAPRGGVPLSAKALWRANACKLATVRSMWF